MSGKRRLYYCSLMAIIIFSLILLPFLVISKALLPSENNTLLSIKKQWGNPTALETWNVSTTTTSPCTWPGIRCSAGYRRITGIILRNRNLTGEIPPSICGLKSLTVLDLGHNTIGGGFPKALLLHNNCFSNLQILDLSHNLFVGKLPNIDIINLFPNLKHLNLGNNLFSGEVPKGLWTLPQISTLILSNNFFSGQLPWKLASTLTQLRINDNNFSGEIPPTVGTTSWPALEVFDASNNSLSGPIPSELSNLQTLNLDGNNLSGESQIGRAHV